MKTGYIDNHTFQLDAVISSTKIIVSTSDDNNYYIHIRGVTVSNRKLELQAIGLLFTTLITSEHILIENLSQYGGVFLNDVYVNWFGEESNHDEYIAKSADIIVDGTDIKPILMNKYYVPI